MGKFIRLDTKITDLSAPILPHPAGVAGYNRRYIVSHLSNAPGSIVSELVPVTGNATLRNMAGTPAAAVGLAGGMKYLRFTTGAAAGGRLWSDINSGEAGSFSYGALVKLSTPGGGSFGISGVEVRKHPNGILGLDKSANYSANSSSEWVFMSVSWNTVAKTFALYINGVLAVAAGTLSITPGAETPINFGTYAAGDSSIAEFTTWPRILSNAEHLAAYGAMKNQYPVLI